MIRRRVLNYNFFTAKSLPNYIFAQLLALETSDCKFWKPNNKTDGLENGVAIGKMLAESYFPTNKSMDNGYDCQYNNSKSPTASSLLHQACEAAVLYLFGNGHGIWRGYTDPLPVY